MPDPQSIIAASFWPGLQNIGQTSGQATVSGTLNSSPSAISASSSNMTGTIFIPLANPSVISLFRVNFPNANGDLSSRWFPLFGSLQVYDTGGSDNFKLIMTIGNAAGGRNVYLNFVNGHSSQKVFTNWPINFYGHLFTYPF